MKSRLVYQENGRRTFALLLSEGDEVMDSLLKFAMENDLSGSHFTGIGEFRSVTLGFPQWESKNFKPIPIFERLEVLCLMGRIVTEEDGPKIFINTVLGSSSGTTYGGHLLDAVCGSSFEVALVEQPQYMQFRLNSSGLNLTHLYV